MHYSMFGMFQMAPEIEGSTVNCKPLGVTWHTLILSFYNFMLHDLDVLGGEADGNIEILGRQN